MKAETKPGREPEALTETAYAAWHRDTLHLDRQNPLRQAFDGGYAAGVAASPAAPAPAGNGVREAETREQLIDRIAQWLHDEVEYPDQYPSFSWPLHAKDTGQREGGGWVSLVPIDVVGQFREIVRRMLRGFPTLATPVSAEEDGLRAALAPFAKAADAYDPVEADGDWQAWGHRFLIGDLRRARAALTPTPVESAKPDTSAADHEARFLIRKGGVYYRPNSQGYTTSVPEAGRYTLAEAEEITYPNGPDGPRDGMSYIEAPAESALAESLIDPSTMEGNIKPASNSETGTPGGDGRRVEDKPYMWVREHPGYFDPSSDNGEHPTTEFLTESADDAFALYPASAFEALQRERDEWQGLSGHFAEKHDEAEARIAELEALCDKWQGVAAELEAALAQERKRAEEAAEDERDRLYAANSGGRHHSGMANFWAGQGAMLPEDRAAARAARGDDNG